MDLGNLIKKISTTRVNLRKEKPAQVELYQALFPEFPFEREYWLDEKGESIIDFFSPETGIGIEMKLQGRAIEIYKQCVRYCSFESMKVLILCTNLNMTFPEPTINGKPAYIIFMAKAWL